jgi:ornithine carbamoyltransferase
MGAPRTTKLSINAIRKPSLASQVSLRAHSLVSMADLSATEFDLVLSLAQMIKAAPRDYRSALDGKQVVMIFEKPSLRTRVTFEAGMKSLGGDALFLDQRGSRIADREDVRDVARNLERWVDGIVLRTYDHSTISEMAKYSRVPVINALSDLEHPCQVLADFMTLKEHFADLRSLKLAYVGDGNNMAHSLMLAAALAGTSITIAAPRGYEPGADILRQATAIANSTGAAIEVTNDPAEAVANADAVYTDVWASMGQEEEAEARRNIFSGFQVNQALMAKAKPHAIFMHCLPAHRGDEVSASVIDSPCSVVFDQAENRLHVQKAILILLLGQVRRRVPVRSAEA